MLWSSVTVPHWSRPCFVRSQHRRTSGVTEAMMGSRGNPMAAVRTLTLAAALLVTCASHAGTPATGFTDDPAVGGLTHPTALAFLPDGRMLVTEKDGSLKLVMDGVATPAGDVPVCTDSEMGLLGIALDPAFASNGRLYLYRTEAAGGCNDSTTRF